MAVGDSDVAWRATKRAARDAGFRFQEVSEGFGYGERDAARTNITIGLEPPARGRRAIAVAIERLT